MPLQFQCISLWKNLWWSCQHHHTIEWFLTDSLNVQKWPNLSTELVHFVICVDVLTPTKCQNFWLLSMLACPRHFFLHFLSASAPWNKHKCFIAHDGWFVICVDALTQMYSVCLSNQVRISFPCHQKKADRTHSRKQTNELLTCHQKRERRENHKYEYLSLIGAWSCSLLMPSLKSDDYFAKGGIYGMW